VVLAVRGRFSNIPTRYPNGLPGGSPFQIYTARDLAEASDDAKRILDLCRAFLEKQQVLA
jgi:HEPN domain-containing protein